MIYINFIVISIPFQMHFFSKDFSPSLVEVIPFKSKQGRVAYQRMVKSDDSATFLFMRPKIDFNSAIFVSVSAAVTTFLAGLSRMSMVLLSEKLNFGELKLVKLRMVSKFLGRAVPINKIIIFFFLWEFGPG